MRIVLAVTGIALLMTVAGCQSSSRGRNLFGRPTSTGGGGKQDLFLGTPPASNPRVSPPPSSLSNEESNLTSSGPTRHDGILAGRILDQDNQLRPGAIIQVIDLEAPREGVAPLSVLANREGYFDISGLDPGKSYRLIARVKDGNRVMTGTTRVVPPNVRVAIFLNDEITDSGRTPDGPGTGSREPAASLGPPIRNPSSGVTTPLPGSADIAVTPAVPPPVRTSDPSLLAEGSTTPRDGLSREAPAAPYASVPGQPGRSDNVLPPPPVSTGETSAPSPAPVEPAPPSGSVQSSLPETNTVIPSCVKVGHRVENFALYDLQGKPFELRKHRKGKLVLLDFWFTDCGPCRRAIPHLNKLQSKYGRYGLEVIGIAYEQGSLPEKQQALENGKKRFGLTFDYKLLFGGGGKGSCPLADQLEIRSYPTLILLDETGKILYRAQGMDPRTAYELEMAIYEKLFPRKMAGR